MFSSTLFTADVLDQFEVFAFENNDNHRETGTTFMNKFHCATLYSVTVRNLWAMKLYTRLDIVVTKAFGNFYLSRKLPESLCITCGIPHIPSFSFENKHTYALTMQNNIVSQKLIILRSGTQAQHWKLGSVDPIPCPYSSAWGRVLHLFLPAHFCLDLGLGRLL